MVARGGHSKGTANVSPSDVSNLKPLIRKYNKDPRGFFRGCVADNRKRFGPKTEEYCAVLKDTAKGTTGWRKGAKKS